MSLSMQAALWSLAGSSSLLIGAAIAFFITLPQKLVSGIMAIGCGVLISAVAYDLLQDGFEEGGIWPIVAGALAGSVVYAVCDWLVSRSGAQHRKRSGDQQRGADEGGAASIAVGALLDGIPESVVLGVGIIAGGGVSAPMLAAIALSNLPEGLSSAAGMKKAGRSPVFIFGLWGGIVAVSVVSSWLGAVLLADADPAFLAAVNAVAAGALLTMVVNTMIPEAVEGDQKLTGVLSVIGLLLAFALTNLAG